MYIFTIFYCKLDKIVPLFVSRYRGGFKIQLFGGVLFGRSNKRTTIIFYSSQKREKMRRTWELKLVYSLLMSDLKTISTRIFDCITIKLNNDLKCKLILNKQKSTTSFRTRIQYIFSLLPAPP